MRHSLNLCTRTIRQLSAWAAWGKTLPRLAHILALALAMLAIVVIITRPFSSSALTNGGVMTALGSPLTEDFNTLATTGTGNAWTDNTTIVGWYSQFELAPANPTTYRADSGGSNTGAIYSWGTGTATERAFGSVASGTPGMIFNAVKLTNNTGSTITSLDISYVGEQWRAGGCTPTPCTPAAQKLDFQYQVASPGTITDANTPGTGWVDHDPLDFTSPSPGTSTAAALDGNAAANRTALSSSITVAINAGQEIWLRWRDINDAGNDHGLAVDDLSVTPQGAGGGNPPVVPSCPASLSTTFGTATSGNISATDSDGTVTAASITGIMPSNPGTITLDSFAPAGAVGGTATAVLNVSNTTPAGVYTVVITWSNNDSPTPQTATCSVQVTVSNPVTVIPINQIQGSGTLSPLSGSVTTEGIVTALKSNGFFLQTPDGDPLNDNNPATSDGIFVFTSSAPAAPALVGNRIRVTGTITDFVSSGEVCSQLTCAPEKVALTELTSPALALVSSGNTLPAAVALTAADMNPAGSIEQLERYEGMRVSVASLLVVAPTDGFVSEPNATSTTDGVFQGVIPPNARPFREAGIEAPEPVPPGSGVTIPPVPRFDGNPERLRVDSDAQTGSTALNVTTGATVTGLVGVLDYAFRTYTLDPDPSPVATVTGNISATPLPDPTAGEFTVASFNLERFYDDVASGGGTPTLTATAFANRLNKASLAIRNILRTPDILGVVEIENLSTLQALAAKINTDAGADNPNYVAYLVEGNDPGGIDVGFLVKTRIVAGTTPRVTVCPTCVVQEGLTATYTNPNTGAQDTLNDRPPLRLNAIVNHADGRCFPITVIVNHLRSLIDINNPAVSGSGTEGGRVRAKRQAQAVFLANLIQARQAANPNERIIAVGDFNAFQVNDGYADLINTILGTPSPDNETVVPGDGADLVNPDLTDLIVNAAPDQQYSYVFGGNAQAIDHLLANLNLTSFLNSFHTGRFDADFPEVFRSDPTRPERISDHDAPIAYFRFDDPPDVFISKNHTGSFTIGQTGQYTIGVSNKATGVTGFGPACGVTVTDTLPGNLTLASFSGTGWTCTGTGTANVSCTNPATIYSGEGMPTLTLTVNVGAGTPAGTDSITNTAMVSTSGETFLGDNSASDPTTVACPTISLLPATLPNGTVGTAYPTTNFTASGGGGSYTFAVTAGALPPGLTLVNGVLSGTPTTAMGSPFSFTITATDGNGCTGSVAYSVSIMAATCPTAFTVNSLGDTPDATPGDNTCADAGGNCTLRAAIQEANAIPACTPLTINFSVTGTINLATALPALDHPNLTINGPGANQLDVHRNVVAAFRIFTINGGRTVAINGLSVTNGNDPAQGGGIYNAGTLTLMACAISGNTAPQGGGIQSDNILTMTSCTVSNNIASDFGGGLKIFGPTTTLTNCTFSNNQSAHDSSAIESHTGVTLTLTNCTIANNQAGTGAGQTGGALFANGGTVLKNTIVTNNSGNNANIAGTVDTANSFNNLVGVSGTGGLTNGVNGNQVGVANANTLLAALGNYGGTTNTIALLPGSPAINAGTSSGAPATDQRGIARPQLGTVDIGAFESRGFTLALAGGNNQSAFVNTAFANPLAVMVTAVDPGEPVNGGKVTFTPPVSGASATIAGNPVTIAGGIANGNATANNVVGGPYTVAASANGATPVINFSLTNTNPPPTIVAGAALMRQQGSAASNSPIATVSDPNQSAGTLTVTATTVPSGITVMNIANNNGAVTADVAAACNATVGANTVVLTVMDSLGATSTANLTVNVTANTAPTLVYASPQSVLAGGSLNVPVLTATDNGSITGYQIVSVTPALNVAPTVNASGTVAITNASPTGSHVITVRATDNCNATTDASFTLNVNCQTITVTPPAVNMGTAGSPFSQTFTQSGGIGTIAWSATGTLPSGITLNSSTGMLGGTPTQTGTFPITVNATDVNGCLGTAGYTLTINCQTITVTAPANNTATAGAPFSATFTQSGGIGATTFSTASTLPNPLTLTSAGVLVGTPTQTGTFPITVKATDSNNCMGTVNYTLTIGCPTFTINPPTLPDAMAGTAYSQTISAVASNILTVTSGLLPPGLQLNFVSPGQAILSGIPTAPGTFTFTVTAMGSGGCTGQKEYTLVVQAGPAPPLTARIDDPLVCTGPGNLLNVTATVTNTNATAQAANFTATLTPTLRTVPGTCTVNVGSCSVATPSTVTWMGTLNAGQTVTINYQVQVNDGVLPGAQLCVTSVATVGTSAPATVTACGAVNCPVVGPGMLPAAASPMSDQKAGSVLIFNIYTSSTNPNQQDTRLNLTNTNPALPAFVHLFFVDGTSCSVADSFLCLTPNQTTSFLASDLDPGSTGYIIAVAVDSAGCPTNFNYLIGDEYVKFQSGHAANLGAEAITAIAGGLPFCNTNSSTATLNFDGVSYNVLPHVLAGDNIPSRADGNDTLLILNRIGGNLGTGAATLGSLFGLFYDDAETSLSFTFTPGTCQFRSSISNNFPRLAPRFEQFVPAGRSGWFKVWMPGLFAMTGAVINFNPNATASAGAFNQGHNLHVLTNTSTASYLIPVFPPSC